MYPNFKKISYNSQKQHYHTYTKTDMPYQPALECQMVGAGPAPPWVLGGPWDSGEYIPPPAAAGNALWVWQVCYCRTLPPNNGLSISSPSAPVYAWGATEWEKSHVTSSIGLEWVSMACGVVAEPEWCMGKEQSRFPDWKARPPEHITHKRTCYSTSTRSVLRRRLRLQVMGLEWERQISHPQSTDQMWSELTSM